jgi:acyl-CoA synthetase (AMP-forming)/AMP-acid ligase II
MDKKRPVFLPSFSRWRHNEECHMRTVGELWERNVRTAPDQLGFVVGETRLTFAQADRRARRLASALYKLGVRRQDRVAMLAMNNPQWLDFYAACNMSGFIAATVNFRLAPPEMEYILKDSSPKVLIFEAQYAQAIESIKAALSGIEHFVCIGQGPSWAAPYDSVLDSGTADGAPTRPLPTDCANLIYTSGTTGRPKGVMRSQVAELAVAAEVAMMMNECAEDRILLMMPMFHVGATWEMLGMVYAGGTTFLHRGFEAIPLLSIIQNERITHTHMAPTMVQALLDTPNLEQYDLSSLKVFSYSAAPMPVPVLRRAIELMGKVFINQYGGTEMGAATQLDKHLHVLEGEGARRLPSVGRPFPGAELAILDNDANVLGPNVTGEVALRGDTLMTAYWNNHTATIEAMRDGWYRTGDMGYLDEQGYLFLVDRKKDMIISGGENIYCKEVEDALMEHAAVADAAIIGVPDPKWGEAVKAIVIPKPGQQPSADDLIAHARKRIAGYKIPRHLEFAPELPRLPSGKVNKVALRKTYGGAAGK